MRNAQAYSVSQLLGLNADEWDVATRVIQSQLGQPSSNSMPEWIFHDARSMIAYERSEQTLLTSFLGLKSEWEASRRKTYTLEGFVLELQRPPWSLRFGDKNAVLLWHTQWATEKAQMLHWPAIRSRLTQLIMGGIEREIKIILPCWALETKKDCSTACDRTPKSLRY